MKLSRFDASVTDQWDAFVARSLNGTLMQTRRFLSYHAPDKFLDHSILCYDSSNQLAAVFPAAEVVQQGQRIWQSHPGASHGGPIIAVDLSTTRIDELLADLVSYASDAGFHAIRWRAPEKVFWARIGDELDTALIRAGCVLEGCELSAVFRVSPSPNGDFDSLRQFEPNARNSVHKARREGVTARATDDFPGFWQLLSANLMDRHQARPTHSLDEIERLRAILGDKVELWGGYHGERLVSGVVMFRLTETAAHIMYIAQDYQWQHLRSLNLVLCEMLQACGERGLAAVNFGISTIPGSLGRVLNHGLHAFKRSCGGEGIARDMWYKSLTRSCE